MSTNIILACKLSTILDKLAGMPEYNDEMRKFVNDHTFTSTDEFGTNHSFFGVSVDGWDTFKIGIDVKPDNISYVGRLFKRDCINTLGFDVNEKLFIVGITDNTGKH